MDQVNSPGGANASRCFLFAAYYSNNRVDGADLFHLKKLAELGDVFVFVNTNQFPVAEVERLRPYVKKVVFEAHEELDFGSWKRLVTTIGFDRLAQYDEIVTVNNSLILVGELGPVLQKFEHSKASFGALLLVDEHYTGPVIHLNDYLATHDVQLSSAMFPSTFWIFTREFFARPLVQNFFLSVKPESNRVEVCYRYERGFTRSIFRHGEKYWLFLDTVFKNSSIYTADAFKMIDLGLPYLKKKSLTQTYYQIDSFEARFARLIKNATPAVAAALQEQLHELVNQGDQ